MFKRVMTRYCEIRCGNVFGCDVTDLREFPASARDSVAFLAWN